MKRRRH